MIKLSVLEPPTILKRTCALLLIAALASCGSAPQSPEDAKFSQMADVLAYNPNPNSPEVVEALAWLEENSRNVNIAYLLYEGASSDVIFEMVKLSGTTRLATANTTHSPSTARTIWGMKITPFYVGNPFQLAISGARPELAERIAIYHAQQAGDYDPNVPLGAIPSVHQLASQQGNTGFHFHVYKGREAGPNNINETVPLDTYVSPPGRGLMFRHASAHNNTLRFVYMRDVMGLGQRWGWKDIANSRTHSSGGRGEYANGYAAFVEKQHRETAEFIYKNFGGDPNEALPYCVMRHGNTRHVCSEFTATQLAGRTTNMNDLVLDSHDIAERNPGKLQAYLRIGGNPELSDKFGNTAVTFAQNGGQFPGDKSEEPLLDFGQIMAGAAIVAGSAYMASEGAYDQAAQFLAGGLSDVATGTTTNLSRMHAEQSKRTAEAEQNLQRHIQVLAEQTYITPETWASTAPATTAPQTTAVMPVMGQTAPTQSQTAAQNQTEQNPMAQGAPAGNVAGMGSFTFTCPESGKSHTLPLPPIEGECLEAAKYMARTTSCNMIDEYPEAMLQYQKACATSIYSGN